MTEALYFPRLSLPASNWVNPAILFFDRIQVIAPLGAYEDLYDRRTLRLIDADIVSPSTPGVEHWDTAADERFIDLLDRLPAARKRDVAPTNVHMGKLSFTRLGDALSALNLLKPERDGWFTAPAWVANEVLTYLALQMSAHAETPASLVTDSGPAWTRATGLTPAERRQGRRLAAVAKLLPAAPQASVEDLIRFRRRHARALAEFHQVIADLTAADHRGSMEEIDASLALLEAEQRRDELIRDLRGANLFTASMQIGLTALPIAAAIMEGSPWSAGAGLPAVGYQLFEQGRQGVRSIRARRNPMIYAAIARARFGR